MFKNIFIFSCVITLVIILAGCSKLNVPIFEIQDAKVFHPPLPRKASMREVKWKVYNLAELNKIVTKANTSGKQIQLIALTPQEYEDLAVNMQELIRNYSQLKTIVIFYKNDQSIN